MGLVRIRGVDRAWARILHLKRFRRP